jgi:DNA-binding NtrC family response regulator
MTIRVLIVNGKKRERECLQSLLSEPGLNIIPHAVETWRDAQVLLETCPFHCVLLDYRLPDVGGVALLRMLFNERTGMTSMPVIMTSGKEDEEALAYTLRCGAQDYILTDYVSPGRVAGAIFNSIDAYKAASQDRESEKETRGGKRGAALIEKLTEVLAGEFEPFHFETFHRILSRNVTANRAGDADVSPQHRLAGSIYWVF